MIIAYPWSKVNPNFIEWMYLPHYTFTPNPIKLGGDFLQLLFASCQFYVFKIEQSEDYSKYPGGQNTETILEPKTVEDLLAEDNPTPDFITTTKYLLQKITNLFARSNL